LCPRTPGDTLHGSPHHDDSCRWSNDYFTTLHDLYRRPARGSHCNSISCRLLTRAITLDRKQPAPRFDQRETPMSQATQWCDGASSHDIPGAEVLPDTHILNPATVYSNR
jgi:hypothetical protein